jgi:ABC-type anion transport system duplicated permease subunit
MGRTVPSITQVFLQEQESFARFHRALRRSDQVALDDLFAAAHQHLAAAAYAAHALPFEVFLLAMLLEEHKEVARLRQMLVEEHDTARRLRQRLDDLSTALSDDIASD